MKPILDSNGQQVPTQKYDIISADPPWHYYGDSQKNAAAGKHYQLTSQEELAKLPVKNLCNKKAALFMWATCPRLDYAIDLIRAWGFHYRGVAWIWVKTRKDGGIINGQGVPPTFTKPTTELVLEASADEHELLLGATTKPRGRAWPIQTSKMAQVILEPRQGHSVKPKRFHRLIEELAGPQTSKLELFCRGRPEPGWHGWGNECV